MITVAPGDPRSPDASALLRASHELHRSLYPPEQVFALSIDDLCAPEIEFFLAHLDGKASGCAALVNKQSYGEIKALFVDTEARGSGIGAALMATLETRARILGLQVLRLETGEELRDAGRLYARQGFSIRGPFGDYDDNPLSVFMEKRLT